MWPIPDLWRTSTTMLDVLAAPFGGTAALAQRRQQRLAALLAAARASTFYRERFHRYGNAFEAQPPVTKSQLMANFDGWLTDPRVTLPALQQFIADPGLIGQPFLGAFAVWESSGSSGVPGIFVQDSAAMGVYDALEALRRPQATSWRRWVDPLCTSERIAFVGVTNGHFASTVTQERLRQLVPGMDTRLRCFSLLQPVDALLAALQDWQPTVLATYPTAALMLAEAAAASHTRLALREVLTGGEALGPAMRAAVARQFACPVIASYGASEFLALAAECQHGHMHLNSDWAILESVDADGHPVPDGETGHTTWLTNLVNHLQPLIRYDLGDQVRFDPAPCPCGSCLPVIEVEGRVDDALQVQGTLGRSVRLPPLALTTVLEEDAGEFDFQLVQTGPGDLCLTLPQGVDAARLARAQGALSAYLCTQGLCAQQLDVRCGTPLAHGRSGKVPRVMHAEAGASTLPAGPI